MCIMNIKDPGLILAELHIAICPNQRKQFELHYMILFKPVCTYKSYAIEI